MSVKNKMKHLEIVAYSGSYSLKKLSRETGYARSQLLRAREKLDQNWLTVKSGYLPRFSITEGQAERLLTYLKQERIPRPDYAARFWPQVTKHPLLGCWTWRGKDRFHVASDDRPSREFTPRQYAWFLVHGIHVQLGQRLFSTCGETRCIAPDHHYVSKVHAEKYLRRAA